MRYKLGISTCPNDTFMFHALLEKRVVCEGFELEIELFDVQELNQRVAQGYFDISKASAYAAVMLDNAFEISRSGSALGFGVGPIVLARPGFEARHTGDELNRSRVLCPGDKTTAYLLFRRYFPDVRSVSHVVFSEIMPALTEGSADLGVVIHEGRFTYRDLGLSLVADLGALWEQEFELPLPLGCVLLSRAIPLRHREEFVRALRASIEYAYSHKLEALHTMQRYSQELSDQVIWQHVDLYVNNWSLDLGERGLMAFKCLKGVADFARDDLLAGSAK